MLYIVENMENHGVMQLYKEDHVTFGGQIL